MLSPTMHFQSAVWLNRYHGKASRLKDRVAVRPLRVGLMFVFSRAGGCNRPLERTGGDSSCAFNQSYYSEASLSSRKSTCAAGNGVNLHDTLNTRCVRVRCTLGDDGSKEHVSIRCNQPSGPYSWPSVAGSKLTVKL